MKTIKELSFVKTTIMIVIIIFFINFLIAIALILHQKKVTSNSLEKHKQIVLSFVKYDSLNFNKLKQSKYYYLLNNSSSIDSFNTYLNQFNEELK